MVRLFHVYYPVRTLILFGGEAAVVCLSFLIAALVQFGPDSYLVLNYEGGYIKIFVVTAVVLLCSYWFDLYDTARLTTKGELFFRLLLVPGLLAFLLAAVSYVRPNYVLGNGSSELGLLILTVAMIGWRLGFGWLVQLPILVGAERVLEPYALRDRRRDPQVAPDEVVIEARAAHAVVAIDLEAADRLAGIDR